MIDIRAYDVQFRAYPVTIITEGVARLLGPAPENALLGILREAVDTAESDEPSGWIFKSAINGTEVWIERFGGMREKDRHEGGQWSVYLPSER